MLGSVLASSVNAAFEETPFARTETFESHTGVGSSPARSALVSFLVMIILFTIILFVGKYLWNSVLSELIPAIKPAKSVFQILGLSILIALLFPGSCQC